MTSPYRLESLVLQEVGVFDDVRLDFRSMPSLDADARKAEIHLFTGPNGCGKSTLLYAIAGIFDGFSAEAPIHAKRRAAPGGTVTWSFGHPSPVVQRQGVYHFGNGRYLAPAIGDYVSGTHDTSKPWVRYGYAVFAYSGARTLNEGPLGAIQQITASPFENALSFDRTVRPELILQWIANNRAQAALAQAEGNVAEAATYERALQRIVALVRDVCDLDVEFRLQRRPLAVSLQVGGVRVPFGGLPDGLKSIISWVADLALRLEAIAWAQPGDPFEQPVILLLDEVDIHLHPKWQRRILPAIQRLLPNAQVFVSTHSPFVVGSVEDAWVYRLPEPGTVNGPLTVEGVPSAAGKSVGLILDEVFGIKDEFDVETEAMFDRFYALRDAFMAGPDGHDPADLLAVAGALAARGDEVAQIVLRELRQVGRLTGRELVLA